jgi:hypothetical protein
LRVVEAVPPEVRERVTEVNVEVRLGGEDEPERLTGPANPFRLVTVTA